MQLVRFSAARRVIPCLFLAFAISSCVSSPEAKSARFIEAGKKLLEKKDAARAILQFQNALTATPSNAEAHYQMAVARLAAGDGVRAGKELKRALELNPKHQEAQLLIAKLMASGSDKEYLEDAQKRLQALVQGSPDNADVLHALALTELKLGDSEDAIRDLTHAASAAPQDVMIAQTLAEAKMRQNDLTGAEEVLKRVCTNNPQSAAAVVLLGRFYLTQKRMADSEQQFQRALALDPANADALYTLAILQVRTGRKAEAEQTMRRLSKLPDASTNATLAIFLFREGRLDESLREFQRLDKEYPDDRLARTRLVTAYQSMNRVGDAEKRLDEALRTNPKDLDALLQRGELLLAARKYGEAERDLNRVLQERPSSSAVHFVVARLYQARGEESRYRQSLSRTVELDPYLLNARVELAGALISSGASKAAVDLLGNAPPSQRNVPALVAQRNWGLWATGDLKEMRKGIDSGLLLQKSSEFLLQDGLWKLRSGNAAGARASLEAAVNADPGDIRALGALNRVFSQQKESSLMLAKVKEFAAKQPKSAPLQEYLGFLLLKQDRVAARAAFMAALAADPRYIQATFSLAQLDVADHKLDDAVNRLQSVLAIDGQNLTACMWLGYIRERQGNHKGAREEFQKIVTADSNNAEALNNLAYLLADEGGADQMNDALKYAQKAQELAPDNFEFADTLGWILYRKGLYPSAVAQLKRAATHEGNVAWKYHLAMAYAKSGDLRHGKETLAIALKANPNLPEAKIAKELVGEAK
jgi:tetratricopeptide (TPR) repeat protein